MNRVFTNERTLRWSQINLPKKVETQHITHDPHSYLAVATIDYYGEVIRGTAIADTRSKAISEAKKVAAQQV